MPYLVGYVTPQDFGAVGNNVADDTTAVQSAINAVSASGGTLFIPMGTYKLSSALTGLAGCSILGAGPGISILNQTSTTANGITYNPASTLQYLSISNLTIQGPSSGSGVGLLLESNSGAGTVLSVSVNNVLIYNFGSHGLQLNNGTASEINACNVTNVGGHCYFINGGTGNVVSSCYAGGGTTTQQGYQVTNASYVAIDGCKAFATAGGYQVTGGSACQLTSCGADTIVAANGQDGSSFKINGGTVHAISSCYSNVNRAKAFYITGSAVAASLYGVQEFAPGAGVTAGIQVDSGSTALAAEWSTVTANTFIGGTTTQIQGGQVTAIGPFTVQPTAAGNTVLSSNVNATDAFDRLRILGSGQIAIGPGTATRDVFLTRAALGIMSVQPTLLVGSQTALGDNGVGEIQLADATTKPTSSPTAGTTIFSQSGSALPLVAFTPNGLKQSLIDAVFVLTGSNTTFTLAAQTATTIALAVESSATYIMESVEIISNTTGNTTFSWTGPTGATMQWNDTTASLDYTSTIGGLGFVWPSNAGTRMVIHKGYLVTSSTAGTLTLTIGVSAGTTTLFTGSYLKLTRVK